MTQKSFDDELREALAPLAGDPRQVADAVVEQLPAPPQPALRWYHPASVVAAAAAGLAIGLLLRQTPEAPAVIKPPTPPPPAQPLIGAPAPSPAPFGALRYARGQVMARSKNQERPLHVLDAFGATDHVATGAQGLAELALRDGTELRLDHETSVSFATDSVRLERGHVWLRWTELEAARSVLAEQGRIEVSAAAEIDVRATAGELSLTTVAGNALLITSTDIRRRIKEDQRGTIRDGMLRDRGFVYWGEEVKAWQLPLLCYETHPGELDAMAKKNFEILRNPEMYSVAENALRRMGPCCSNALIRFLHDTPSRGNPPVRERAASVLSDVVAIRSLPELLVLLRDPQPAVRADIAMAIVRVTGMRRRDADFWLSAPAAEREVEAKAWAAELEPEKK